MARKEKEIRQWYKQNLPEVKVGKFTAKRFEVKHADIEREIIINRKFYEEVIGRYTNKPDYFKRLELLKEAHNLIVKADLSTPEKSKHHPDADEFLVLIYEKEGLKIEFKCKDNPDGIFLYYMRLLD